MASLRVLVPEATVNYVTNPAFRYDTTDWNVQGATLTRTLTRARFGVASGQVVTSGAALHEGVFFRVSALDGISDVLTISVYLRGAGKVRLRLDDNAIGGGEYVSQPIFLEDERWTRYDLSGRSHGGDDLRLYVETDEDAAAVRTFYVDGAQMERLPYPTSYCDGDQEGCRWNGIYHDSSSQRPASTRAGGRWVELSGPERENEDLYMTVSEGLGMAPLVNTTQSYALAPGGYHQGIKVEMREITLVFYAKHKVDGRFDPVSLEYLHALRQLLIDTIKPDLTGTSEDIWFEYQDGPVPLYFRARYGSGLEGSWDVRNQFVNSFTLKLTAVNPLVYEDSQETQVLDFQEVLLPNYAAGRIDGKWSNLNGGFDGNVLSFVLGPRGEIYAVGTFDTVNNDAGAINPLTTGNGVAYWDGEKWIPMVTNGVHIQVRALDVAPNGYVYVGGTFTTIDGVAAAKAAYWDGSSWNALGAGFTKTAGSAVIQWIKAAPDGNVYFGGEFDGADGVSCYNIARWDGGSFHRLGQYGGLNDRVFALEINYNNTVLYVGGQFTDQQGLAGSALLGVAQYNISSGLFSAMGSGFTYASGLAYIYTLKITRSGSLVAGGQMDASGTTPIDYAAEWKGNAWLDLGGAFNTTVERIGELFNNSLFFSGNMTLTGSIPITGVALFNGSTFVPFDIRARYSYIQASLSNYVNNDIFINLYNSNASNGGFMQCSGITIVNNPGTHKSYPVFFVTGPGRLRFIENQTTQQRMYFDLLILEGEEITIDTGAGTITSQIRSDLFYAMLSGSDFHSFVLLPGDNTLACFIYDDVDASISVQFPVVHWGVDATGEGTEE